jgi:hypothetical protein
MKNIRMGAVLLVCAALFGCDGGKIEGTYYNSEDPREVITLKGDGKYELKSRNEAISGKYSYSKGTVTLNPGEKAAAIGKLEGDVITDKDGLKWKRK